MIGIASAFAMITGFKIHRDVVLVALRMQEVEAMVNKMAGEEVMTWETRWGGSALGYIGRYFKKPPSTPSAN